MMSDSALRAAIDRRLADPRLSRLQLRVVVLCGLIAMAEGFDTQAIAFAAPALVAQFAVDPVEIGIAFAAGLAGLTIGAILFGRLSDRVGRKRMLLLCSTAFGLLSLATASVNTFEMLVLLRFLTGLGLGGAMPVTNILTAEYAPLPRRALMMTLMFAGFPAGAVLGGLISIPLIDWAGWRAVFVFGGILPLVLLPILAARLPESLEFLWLQRDRKDARERLERLLREMPPPTSRSYPPPIALSSHETGGFPALFQDGRASLTFGVWTVFFVNLLLLYALLNWLPLIMVERASSSTVGLLFAVLFNAGGVAGGLTISALLDRYGTVRAVVIAYVAAAVICGLIAVSSLPTEVAMGFIALLGFCIIGAQLGMNAVVAKAYPAHIRGTALGSALGVGRIGSVIGPFATGALVQVAAGNSALFGTACAFALLAGVILQLAAANRTM